MDYNKILERDENIVKVVIPREIFSVDKQNIKLIFLNIISSDLKAICKKIEENKEPTKAERAIANNIIPYFFKKIGDTSKYLVRFVYRNIMPDIQLNQFKIILFNELLRLQVITKQDITRSGMLLYSFKYNYDIAEYNNFINYLLHDVDTISGSEILKLLKKKKIIHSSILNNKTDKEILQELELLPDVNYMSYELLSRPKLQDLFNSLPHIYSIRNTVFQKRITNSGATFKVDYPSYEGYSRDFFIDYENMNTSTTNHKDSKYTMQIKQYLKYDLTDNAVFNEKKYDMLYSAMNINVNSTNNVLYCYLVSDIADVNNDINKVKSNFANMILLNKNFNSENDNLYNDMTNNIIYYPDKEQERKSIISQPTINIDKTVYNKVIYQLYDIQLDYNLNLLTLFQELISSKDIPIIYLVSGGEVKYYNIYRNILRDINKKNISIYMKDDLILKLGDKILSNEPNTQIKKLRYLKNLEYIKFKRQINQREYINIYLFENGYIIGEINNQYSNYELNEMVKQITMLNVIVKKIKSYFKLQELPVPNVEKLIKFTSGDMLFNSLIDMNITLNFSLRPRICYIHDTEVENKKYKWDNYIKTNYIATKTELLNKLNKSFTELINENYNYQQITGLGGKKELIFIYKNQDFFYSDNNIRRFMIKECSGKNLTDKFKNKLFSNVEFLFSVSNDYARKLFKDIESNITQSTKTDITYITFIINFEKETITFKNLLNKYQYINILKDINKYFKQIIFNLKNESPDKQTVSNKTIKTIKLEYTENDLDSMFDDFDIDDDLGALDELLELENKLVSESKKDSSSSANKDINRDIIKKGKVISINKYMSDMRSKFDTELYNPVVNGQKTDYKYGRSKCPNTKMRQPFIVSKEQLADIDPEAITGYMKYRDNYYICPRIWDAIVNKPISVRKFIDAGLKSPYTGTKPILESKSKKHITDEYGVIIRKPITDTQWEDKGKHPEWPKILKKTEKDAYPGLTYSADHPAKTCVPCCFINMPEDYNETIAGKELQGFEKPFGYQKCNFKPGSAIKEELTVDDKYSDENECKSEPYISGSNSILKNCRLGLLPENLDILLNNNQQLFLNKNETALINGSGLFLRRGIIPNENYNFLSTMTNILGLPNVSYLVNYIENKLSPIDFIDLNNGTLVDIFCSGTKDFINDKSKFIEFLRRFPKLLTYLSIDSEEIISKLKNIEIPDNITYEIEYLYDIFTGWRNYIRYINNKYEFKNYEYLVELFVKPRDWLIKDGANILIFDTDINKMECLDTINSKTKNIIMMIKESNKSFIPVAYVEYKFNKLLPAVQVIELNDKLNINKSVLKKEYQHIDTNRTNNLVKLLYIQNNLCNYNLKKFNKKVIAFIKSKEFIINKQYNGFGNKSGQIEFIEIVDKSEGDSTNLKRETIKNKKSKSSSKLSSSKLILPLYSNKYLYKTNINSFDNLFVDISNNKCTLRSYLKLLNEINESNITEYLYNELLITFNYTIKSILVEKINNNDYIIAVRFMNELIQPVVPELLSLYKNNELEANNIKLEYKTYPNILKQSLNSELSDILISDKKYIYNEINNIINIIKNQLSIFIAKKLNKYVSYVNKIKNGLITLNDIKSLLSSIISSSNSIKLEEFITAILNKDITKLICDNNDKLLCFKATNKLKIPAEIYNYIIYKVYKDVKNNKLEAYKIFKGKFIYSNNINKSNVILSQSELSFILTNKLMSKYIKNFKFQITNDENIKTISPANIKLISNILIDDISKFKSINLISETIMSIKEIKTKRKIHTTVFNSHGLYNPSAKMGICKFPYRNISGQINYKCSDAKSIFNKDKLKSYNLEGKDQICPITVDKNKKTKTFGYCPEVFSESINRLNVDDKVDAYKYKDGQLVKSGECTFPFIYYNKSIINPLTGKKPFIQVSFKCQAGKIDEGTWCYSKQNGDHNLPVYIAAKNRKYIYEGEWHLDKFMKDGQIDVKNLKQIYDKSGYERGICTTKIDKYREEQIEKMLQLDNVKQITLEEYNPQYCILSESKRGYTKKQLYLFGKNVLGLNYEVLINKNNKIHNKGFLCSLFNKKIRELKKQKLGDKDSDNFYKLNPENCLNGPKKGGYKLNELRDLVITYLGYTEEKAYSMDKNQLCKLIKPKTDTKLLEIKATNELYPVGKNINLCEKPVNRGGINKTKLNNVATKLGIEIAGKKKPELCKLIRNKINYIRTQRKKEDKREFTLSSEVTDLIKEDEDIFYDKDGDFIL
jgi:hypothetical protein